MTYSNRLKKYFNLAKNASLFSDYKDHHLGAVLIYKNKVISMGWNSTKTSPIQKKYNILRGYDVENANNRLHAEMSAILKIKDLDIDFSKVKLYVYREHKNGVKALAMPCPACQKMIKDMGIKEVWFTTENGFGYEWMED